MSKVMMINGSTANFLLDDSVDIEQLNSKVKKAMIYGSIIEMPVLLADHGGEPATLLLNGQALSSVAFAEL